MLTDKVALVTGGSGGIGRGIALALAKAGAFVLVNYNGSADKAQAFASARENTAKRVVLLRLSLILNSITQPDHS